MIKWQTAEESGLKHYEVERSLDGIHFTRVGLQWPAPGKEAKSYSLADEDIPAKFKNTNQFYYRLKMTGTDGDWPYSKIQRVFFKEKTSPVINVFPNPFTDKIEISVNEENEEYVNTSITNVSGKTLINVKNKISKGLSKISINNLGRLPKGIYFVKLSIGDEIKTYKI